MSAFLTLVVSGCGSLDDLPFLGNGEADNPAQPRNAAHYVCKGGKNLYVRMLEKENAAWVIYPDREVRFEKTGAKSGERYTNGIAILEINGAQASIQDGADTDLADCKVAVKQEAMSKK